MDPKDIIQIVYELPQFILITVGYWKIFEKCGEKKWYALIPCFRNYRLSVIADREREGRSILFLTGAVSILQIIWGLISKADKALGSLGLFVLVCFIAAGVAEFIYEIRIYSGLCRLFQRKKSWMLLWIPLDGVGALIWGLHPGFQPVKKLDKARSGDAAEVSGVELKSIGQGLSVNITERSVIDFFQKKILLKDIHLNIPLGHMVLLLGGSGAGKTTFVNAVSGYEKADANVLLKERDIYKEYGEMKYEVGFVPQQDLMRGHDTVLLTLMDAATLRLPLGMPFKEKTERVNEMLESFGLWHVRNSLVEKLSGGQRKRLSIAMEFISDPSLFILDEPDSGLDGVVARGLFEKLRSIADENKIVLVITHTPDRVIDLFDDVIVLAKDASRTGRLAYYGPVKEAYEFFGKDSMEEILLSINQKDEGGEGMADEFVAKYAGNLKKEAV